MRGYLCCGERFSLNEHVDGGGQGEDVIRVYDVSIVARPNMREVKDFKSKPTGVVGESASNNKIRQELSALLPIDQLQD